MISLISPPAPAAREQTQPAENFLRLLKLQLSAEQGEEPLADLEITNAVLREQRGQVELSFTLKQRQATPQSLEELLLLVVTPEQSFTTTLTSNQATAEFSLLLPEPPSEIRLDPYFAAPRRLGAAETPATWAGFIHASRRLAVVPDQAVPDHWPPLLAYLAEQEIEVLPLAELQDQELAETALLFLSDGVHNPARAFLPQPDLPTAAITLEARDNPFNPEYPAILLNLPATPSDNQELLLDHLRGDGLFSRLQIRDGATEHHLTKGESGILVNLDRPPTGIPVAALRDFRSIMAELAATRVIYVGEIHNRYEDHLLQLRVLRAMHRQNPRLAVGMEMLPHSAQPALDAYLAGELDERRFLKEAKWFDNWSFDYRLYREIIDFAHHNRLPIIALNLEKGITGQVFREGIAALTPEEQAQLPPERDLGLPGYRERIGAAFQMHDLEDDPEEQRRRFGGFLQAQSLWDEQMAATMAQFLAEHPDHRMLAVVGQGHTDKVNAIPPRLARRLPVTQAVIAPARANADAPETADYLIFIESQSLPEPALLGVRIRDGEEDSPGALVVGLNPRGSASQAGIKENDLIIGLNDAQISDTADLRIALLYMEKGQEINVLVRRLPPAAEEGADPPADELPAELLNISVTL